MNPLLPLFASTTTALAVMVLGTRLVPPSPRLSAMVDVVTADQRSRPGRTLRTFLPLADAVSGGEAAALRLRQAGLTRGRVGADVVAEHQLRLLTSAAAHAAVAAVALVSLGWGVTGIALAAGVAAVAGIARAQGRIDRMIAQRRERIQLELSTVNQLLALDVRAGGGVAQALERVSVRGRGVLASEFAEILSSVRAGLALVEALELAAMHTPEPTAARTYRLLAKGSQFGADLGVGLRALNADLHSQRAQALERSATGRRAAMLIPIIGLLAPVMLLFIAAPLPSIVFGMP